MTTDPVPAPGEALAERFAGWAAGLGGGGVPGDVKRTAERALLDVAGLCLAARTTDYVAAVGEAWPESGRCTAFGHNGGREPTAAAALNGTAAHGEDFDDTFEGTPVHVGAVAVPAVLAACEAHGRSGADLLKGIAVAGELSCRMAVVAPTAQHRAGFHPTAVIGAMGAAAGVSAALGGDRDTIASALGIAGSMASGIIEYLAEGTWTKRLHPGWAAQSGIRAARLAAAGFKGPRTVLEGTHGFYMAFGVDGIAPDFSQVTDGLGEDWRLAKLAFKPYACGTMCQPFVDVARRLAAEGLDAAAVERIECKVGEGTVHRLWEPRAEKIAPSTPYSAKFSVPYCVAVALIDGDAGLGQFTEARIADSEVLDLASRVAHVVDPKNEYPRNYTGHLKVTCRDGRVLESVQPHLRGGRHEPLAEAELAAKFRANAAHGGWDADRAAALEAACRAIFDDDDLEALKPFQS